MNSEVPSDPALYHITHVTNLPKIIEAGGLLAENLVHGRGVSSKNIGYSHIKARRRSRTVPVAARGVLADYVPFNFCARSVMLYVVAHGHDDYDQGEDDVVHLVTRLSTIDAHNATWCFTDRHAELGHALFFEQRKDLAEVDWSVMNQRYWAEVKEERQAEFLVHQHCPWEAILGIGVKSSRTMNIVMATIATASYQPKAIVKPDWYYGVSRP